MTDREGRVIAYLSPEGLANLAFLQGKWAPNRKRTVGLVIERALAEAAKREKAVRAGSKPVDVGD